LEELSFLRRTARIAGGQTSNLYEFLWHPIFDAWLREQESAVQETAREGMQESAPGPVKKSAPKESNSQDGHSGNHQRDPDCPTTNRKNCDSQSAGSESVCRQYPRLREILARYFMERGQEKLYPTDRLVVDVIDAAQADEEAVINCLYYLYTERGLRPGTRNGPRHWSWFKTVVADHFDQQRNRFEAANPSGWDGWEARNEQREWNEEFARMTNAIEIDGSAWR
jgi:hypothetical protein